MAAEDPAVASSAARIAALERWSREDPSHNAARGQQGLLNKFRREIETESPGLGEAELTRPPKPVAGRTCNASRTTARKHAAPARQQRLPMPPPERERGRPGQGDLESFADDADGHPQSTPPTPADPGTEAGEGA